MTGSVAHVPTRGAASHPGSLAETAYARLEEMLVTSRLAPGSVLSEAVLGKLLGLGRTPVREALQRLARERLVRILPQRGIVVPEIDTGNFLRALELRRVLERQMSRSAARRATQAQRQGFRNLAGRLEDAARACEKKKALRPAASPYCSSCWKSPGCDGSDFLRLDGQYCSLLFAASANEFSADAATALSGVSRRFWYLFYRQAADLALGARLRARAARAIAKRDADGAAQAAESLMDYAEAFARTTLSADF
ncbi:MAG: GntR family transcriptional regulator [Betaproteobacteria bacterium]|nr:GntR family transcriptional regulator [Betaproteobacteria bacterium]